MGKSFKSLSLLIVILSLFVYISFVSDDPRIAKIINKVNVFAEKCSPQKIHIHTDKDLYMVGETMWMKAYLLSASSILPDTTSKDIYVDLVDMNNRPVAHLTLKNYGGFSKGDMALGDSLMEGNYQLRAYTEWMRNFDPDFFFYKTITIKNPYYENVVTKSKLKEIKQFNSNLKLKESEHHIAFFPEGGSLVAGLPSNVAFKGENGLADALKVKGVILDNKGSQVVSFESSHDGMGVFKLTPQAGVVYTAQITYENGTNEKVPIPESTSNGVVMTVDASSLNNIKVLIQSNRPKTDGAASEIIIVGQSRGVVTYVSKGMVKDKVLSVIPKKAFPSGVAQITLFDSKGEPICERLVFVDHTMEQVNQIKLTNTNSGDSVFLNVKLEQANGNNVAGNFSLAVLDNAVNTSASSTNILTNLLFASDLKGRINNPLYYFDKNNIDAAKQLDLVMMTNGWRRFVWKDILNDKYFPLPYPREGGLAIKGHLVSNSSESFYNSKVAISFPQTNNYKVETTPDSKGAFYLPLLGFDDTLMVKVETSKANGSKLDGIIIDEDADIAAPGKPFPTSINEQYDKDKISVNTRNENAESKKRSKSKSDNEQISKPYGAAGTSIKISGDVNTYSNILQYMQGRVPGVEVRGNDITIRGVSSINGSTQPLFVLDGVTVDLSSVLSLSPSGLEQIDVLKGSDASIYGSRGANGVILFYSKRARLPKIGSVEFNMVGYHKTREFYIPPYESWAHKPSEYQMPTTIYWNPYVVTNSAGEAKVSFARKSATGKYTMVLEGITSNGDVIYSKIQN